MTDEQLRNDLIKAAQEQRFTDLMSLLDQHQPDLTLEDFKIRADDGTFLNSAAHVLISYSTHFCPCEDVQTILLLGACVNSNVKSSVELTSRVRSEIGMPTLGAPYPYYAESRPLVIAINQGKLDMTDLLINYACPCCNGSGAKITPLIQELAEKVKYDHADGVEIINVLAQKVAA